MIKKYLIEALSEFGDDENIALDFGDRLKTFIPKIVKICGKRESYTAHTCVLEPGHDGYCYCGCKDVYFEPDME